MGMTVPYSENMFTLNNRPDWWVEQTKHTDTELDRKIEEQRKLKEDTLSFINCEIDFLMKHIANTNNDLETRRHYVKWLNRFLSAEKLLEDRLIV